MPRHSSFITSAIQTPLRCASTNSRAFVNDRMNRSANTWTDSPVWFVLQDNPKTLLSLFPTSAEESTTPSSDACSISAKTYALRMQRITTSPRPLLSAKRSCNASDSILISCTSHRRKPHRQAAPFMDPAPLTQPKTAAFCSNASHIRHDLTTITSSTTRNTTLRSRRLHAGNATARVTMRTSARTRATEPPLPHLRPLHLLLRRNQPST